jgi:OmpA-OmpF porin, OOP family
MKKSVRAYVLILICVLMCSPILFAQKKSATIKATVTDMNNKPRSGDRIEFVSVKTKSIHLGISDINGGFEIQLQVGDTFEIKIKGIGTDQDYYTLPITTTGTYDLSIQYEPPKIYTLGNVYFDTGKSTLKPESFTELNELVEVMRLKTKMVVEIAGHTDDIGDDTDNLKLSQGRADSVKKYLISRGISPSRIIAKGYGDTQAVVLNDSDENRQKNRRTEVRIIKE